jgi:hypothetical protein
MSLNDVLKFAKSLDDSDISAGGGMAKKEYGATKLESAYQIAKPNRSHRADKSSSSGKNEQKCFKCGYEYPHKLACPARDKTCKTCGQKGHFAKCCRKGKSSHSNGKTSKVGKAYQLKGKEPDDKSESDRIGEEPYDFSIFAVSGNEKSKCPRVTFNILGSNVEAGIDTQASINALKKDTYLSMVHKPELVKDDSLVFSFDGSKPLKSIGKFKARIRVNNRSTDFCDEFGIKHRRITPAWPQANGQVEVFNRNIKRIIQKSFISNSDWRTELNGYLRSYRNTPHSSTKVAPADLVFVGSNSSKLPGLVKHRSSNVDLVSIARENDLKSKQRMKDYADAKRGAKSHDLKVNDEVFVDQNYGKKIVNKYSPRWSSQIWKVKLMNGSLVTVESNGKQLTRNSVFFKKVSDGLSKQIGNDSDLFDERLWYSGRESGKSKAMGRMESNETVSDVGLTGEDNDASVPRRSTRSVRQVDRFVAGPASGLRSKASKT